MMQFKIDLNSILRTLGRKQRTIGYAFGGGGAKGFSHIGILMAMEEFGLNHDIVSGVSAGSVAAVMYASGMTPVQMRECFIEANSFGNFTDWAIPKNGIFKLNKFSKLLKSWIPVSNLEELQIPTVVCATNLTRGTQVGWSKGEIAPRVIASCSVPIIFKPVRINGEYYVDGGVLHNLPAWAIREQCDMLFGFNCSPLNRKYTYKDSIISIAARSFQLGMKANVLQDMNICDYVVKPRELSQAKVFDISKLDQNIELGYEAASKLLAEIAQQINL